MMIINGMKLAPLALPAVIRLYPRENPGWQMEQVPKVFALEWLPAGLLCQFRAIRLQSTPTVQTHYRVIPWAELAEYIIITEDRV